ncbi:MAG: hypothetical protein IT332_09965 [Ardenticatenales bacterium]|nr:hypothetical protein [Ardenticatenales bacterium]
MSGSRRLAAARATVRATVALAMPAIFADVAHVAIDVAVAADPTTVCTDAPAHPEWIFCDDFESAAPNVGVGRYFEIDDDDGDFERAPGVGRGGSHGMRTAWQQGEVGAGGLKVAFGRNPIGYMNRSRLRPNEDFREVWVRLDVRHDVGWVGDPAKLSRVTVFTHAGDWRQAMVAHLWGDGKGHLLVDPARCIDAASRVKCATYNDFASFEWLGYKPGTTAVFDTANSGRWYCVVHHVRLNDSGQANGVQEFFIDGRLEARRDGLDFVRSYRDFALNAVFVENYWNDGSVKDQERYFDNLVISAGPIECPVADGVGEATATATATSITRTTSTATPPSPPSTATPTSPSSARWSTHLPWAAR